jgi:hypothetical protein
MVHTVQGPVGQMAYHRFGDRGEVIVSTQMALHPQQLAAFLVDAVQQRQHAQEEHDALHAAPIASNTAAGENSEGSESTLSGPPRSLPGKATITINQANLKWMRVLRVALSVARQCVQLLEEQLDDLQVGSPLQEIDPAHEDFCALQRLQSYREDAQKFGIDSVHTSAHESAGANSSSSSSSGYTNGGGGLSKRNVSPASQLPSQSQQKQTELTPLIQQKV